MYYPHYIVPKEESRGRYSKDPKLREEYARLYSPTKLCHEILELAKKDDAGALGGWFEAETTGRAKLSTVYPRFPFDAWLDLGGSFVAKDVTIFQAALLQPEEYYTECSDGCITGRHTGKAFVTLLQLLDKYTSTVDDDKPRIDKSVLLNQDGAGRTVLHTLVLTQNEQTDTILSRLRESLANEPQLREELWGKRDKRGKRYDDYLR